MIENTTQQVQPIRPPKINNLFSFLNFNKI
jgi:hypothetical protein